MTLAKCDDRFGDSLLYPFEKGQILFSSLDRKLADLAQNSGCYYSQFRTSKRKVSGWGKGVMKVASIQGWVSYILGFGIEIYFHTQNTTDLINNVGNLFSYITHTKHLSSVSGVVSSSKLQSALLLKITIIYPVIQPDGGVCCTRLGSQYNINKWPLVEGQTKSHS